MDIILVFVFVLFFHLLLLLLLFRRERLCGGKRAGKIRPPINEIIEMAATQHNEIKYGLQDLSSPKLLGHTFKLFITLAYTYLGRHFILPILMLRKSNLDLFKGEYIPERPTLFPKFPIPQVVNRRDTNKKVLLEILNSYKFRGGDWRCTMLDYYTAYKSGQITPFDVAKKVLKCVSLSNERNPPLRGVIEVIDRYTLQLAESSTVRWREGRPLSLVDGIPFTVKSEVVFESFSLMAGSVFKPSCSIGLKETVIIRRLVDAGAIMIGIDNMQEFGTGLIGSNPHPNYLTPRNPYDDQCYCGGSSSGSAATVAAGLCPLAIGGDAGGSIRVPASLCGIVGLKPTFGLLDTTGFLPQTCSVGVPGPMCTSTLDAAIAMNIMCPEGIDLSELNHDNLKGLKIGIYKEFFNHADSDTVMLCKKAIVTLTSLGAEIKDVSIPELEEVRVAHALVVSSEFCNSYTTDTDARFDEINPETLMLILIGSSFTSREYINALKQRTRTVTYLESLFKDVDLIVTPSAGSVAPPIPQRAEEYGYGNAELAGRLMRFSSLANLTGIPGLTIPVGLSSSGELPVGLQLMSHWNNEGLLLRVGYSLEKQVSSLMSQPKCIYYNIIEEMFKV